MSLIDDSGILLPWEKGEDTYKKPSCKYCGKGNLNWKQSRKGEWALYTDGGTKHVCKEFITGLTKVGKTEKVK